VTLPILFLARKGRKESLKTNTGAFCYSKQGLSLGENMLPEPRAFFSPESVKALIAKEIMFFESNW
jgi:hypothetical protein